MLDTTFRIKIGHLPSGKTHTPKMCLNAMHGWRACFLTLQMLLCQMLQMRLSKMMQDCF